MLSNFPISMQQMIKIPLRDFFSQIFFTKGGHKVDLSCGSTTWSDLCALTKKINDNALSLIFQMANE